MEKVLPKPVENKWKISLGGSFRRYNSFTGVSQNTPDPGPIRYEPSIGPQKTCMQMPALPDIIENCRWCELGSSRSGSLVGPGEVGLTPFDSN